MLAPVAYGYTQSTMNSSGSLLFDPEPTSELSIRQSPALMTNRLPDPSSLSQGTHLSEASSLAGSGNPAASLLPPQNIGSNLDPAYMSEEPNSVITDFHPSNRFKTYSYDKIRDGVLKLSNLPQALKAKINSQAFTDFDADDFKRLMDCLDCYAKKGHLAKDLKMIATQLACLADLNQKRIQASFSIKSIDVDKKHNIRYLEGERIVKQNAVLLYFFKMILFATQQERKAIDQGDKPLNIDCVKQQDKEEKLYFVCEIKSGLYTISDPVNEAPKINEKNEIFPALAKSINPEKYVVPSISTEEDGDTAKGSIWREFQEQRKNAMQRISEFWHRKQIKEAEDNLRKAQTAAKETLKILKCEVDNSLESQKHELVAPELDEESDTKVRVKNVIATQQKFLENGFNEVRESTRDAIKSHISESKRKLEEAKNRLEKLKPGYVNQYKSLGFENIEEELGSYYSKVDSIMNLEAVLDTLDGKVQRTRSELWV